MAQNWKQYAKLANYDALINYRALIKENKALKTSLYEMLETYWGEGDGYKPPAFITRANRLLKEHK